LLGGKICFGVFETSFLAGRGIGFCYLETRVKMRNSLRGGRIVIWIIIALVAAAFFLKNLFNYTNKKCIDSSYLYRFIGNDGGMESLFFEGISPREGK
jgi:hypothetical protein